MRVSKQMCNASERGAGCRGMGDDPLWRNPKFRTWFGFSEMARQSASFSYTFAIPVFTYQIFIGGLLCTLRGLWIIFKRPVTLPFKAFVKVQHECDWVQSVQLGLGILQTKKSIADAICESCLEEGTFLGWIPRNASLSLHWNISLLKTLWWFLR